MAQSYVTVPRTSLVFIGHICSNCGAPIVTTAKIHAKALQHFMHDMDRAYDNAEKECEKAIIFEKSRIKNCVNTHEELFVNATTVSKSHYGDSCVSSIIDISTPCLNCQHLEKWQAQNGVSTRSENFPKVFEDLEEAEEWAENIIINMKNDISKKRLSQDKVDAAAQESSALIDKIKSYKQMLLEIPERIELDQLNKEKEELIVEQKNVAILNFKKSRLIKSKLAEINQKSIKLNATILQLESEPKKLLQDANLKLYENSLVAYGFYENINILTSYNTKVYLIKPKTI